MKFKLLPAFITYKLTICTRYILKINKLKMLATELYNFFQSTSYFWKGRNFAIIKNLKDIGQIILI